MFRFFLVIILLAVSPPGASGLTASPEQAAAYAVRHNPDLAAARWAVEEARGRLTQAGRWPNPELEGEARPRVTGREFSVGVGFMQRFPRASRLRLEKEVSQAELAVAEAEVRVAERRLATEVKTLAVKMQALAARHELTQRQIAHGRELSQTAAKIAATGEGSSLDAAQFDLEAQQLALAELQNASEKTALAGELRVLLGLGANEAVEISGALREPSAPAPSAPDVSKRHDYTAAETRAEAARRQLSLQRQNRWEDIGVGLAAEVERGEDAPNGMETDAFLGLKISVPLPLWNKNEGKIQEAQATLARVEKEKEAVAARIRGEAAAARAEMTAAAAIYHKAASELLPAAQQLEQKFQAAYQNGQASITEVLRSREKRFALETARLEARRDFNLARVRHDAALGR